MAPSTDRADCIVKGRISIRIAHKECVRVHLPHPLNQSRLETPDNQMQQSVASFVAMMHLTKKLYKKEMSRRIERGVEKGR